MAVPMESVVVSNVTNSIAHPFSLRPPTWVGRGAGDDADDENGRSEEAF